MLAYYLTSHPLSSGTTITRKRDSTAEGAASRPSFAFDYGTNTAQSDSAIGQAPEKELTALEEENIFDHLDDLTSRDRTTLDSLGKEFYIKDYYRVLRVAKEEEDERVNQLKVTAVVSPLKMIRMETMVHTDHST